MFHDWIYHTHKIDRKAADLFFCTLLISSSVGKTKAVLIREAVQNFGAWCWENDPDDRTYLKQLAMRIKDDGRDPAHYGM